ncbi:LytTR family DNA-binding domain-containing protein [Listeria seeligeri]|uniref:LytTR family DNA-binding domain-containing protein n=1 Tax=Listeria seeligeri TaxID=1640 RepID=UPI0016256349|nr:LytTR family DNA-binding domain-containing protein [Listeria seeligeri]MBC1722576.1 LytTR family transcriptional regulator [Listeria seeligeri]MBF2345106.1 LytTR family transcriptional regulator DNA-binding domain-containing protein [Listeria seeligeri]MBF2436103.1 LytTR family transcriptional regulator DNA-binding domain-containing protein [Listeria seeligeri]
MKFRLKQDRDMATGEVEIHCHPSDMAELSNTISNLEEKQAKISVKKAAETYLLEQTQILYFEAVENKIFVYTEKEMYETHWKLYELEERFKESTFFRCSKSMILNIEWIEKVSSGFNGRFEAKLINGEKVIISRQYAKVLKQKLQIGGRKK